MKRHLSTIVFGCHGLCAGFALCYLYLVIPEREANLPISFPPQKVEQTAINGKVARDGSIYLGNKRIDTNALTLFLKDHAAQGDAIVIRADRNTDYAMIVALLNVCMSAGVSNIALASTSSE